MTNNINNKYFYSEFQEGVITLHLDYTLLLEDESFAPKNTLLEFLELVDKSEDVKTLVISNDFPTFHLNRFIDKWNEIYEGENYETNIIRVFRTYNQVLLKIKSMHKVIITVLEKPVNNMLFNLSMASDLRIASRDFYVNNDNYNFANIPKGGTTFIELSLMHVNPIKILFQTDKFLANEMYKKHMVDEIFNPEDISDRVSAIAKRYSKFDYIEFEAVKMIEQTHIEKLDNALQKENDHLLTCIRKRKNSNEGHLSRIK